MQVLLLGLDKAGKSSVLARLCGEEVRGLLPTRGFSIRTLAIEGRAQPAFKVWDVGGGYDVRRYWSAYYHKAHAIVFVVDATDRRRLQEISEALQALLDDPALLRIPFLLLANKQDLPNALQAHEARLASEPMHHQLSAAVMCRCDPATRRGDPAFPVSHACRMRVQLEEVLHLGSIKDRAWMCVACSALRGAGLSEAFMWLHQAEGLESS